jgi:tetratricopeptide (TPR) repeat protein
MTPAEEIETLKVEIAGALNKPGEAEKILYLLDKHATVLKAGIKPFVDRLLQLADELNQLSLTARATYYLSIFYRYNKEYAEAINHGKKAFSLFEQLNDTLALAQAENNIGIADELQANYAGAMKSYLNALKLSKEAGDKTELAASYNNMAHILEAEGDYAGALKNYELTLEIKTELGDIAGIATACNDIGAVNYYQGNYGQALKYYTNALHNWQEAGYKKGIADAYNNMGNIHQHQGNYPGALKNHLLALGIRQEIDHKKGIAGSYNNIGVVYYRQGNFEEAIQTFIRMVPLMEEEDDKLGLARLYANIGVLYQSMKDDHRAMENDLIALKISEQIGDKPGIAAAYNNMAVIYYNQADYAAAFYHHSMAFKIRSELGDKRGMAESSHGLGEVYEKQGDSVKALENKLAACLMAEEIGNKELLKECSLSVYNTYKAAGDFENALKYHIKYHGVEQELLGKAAQEQLTALNFQHNMEQKEREAEIERLKNVELKEAFEKLQLEKNRSEQLFRNQLQDLRSGALQAQMNPHFVFNSLNSIQQFIWEKDPEQATAYLNRFSGLIRAVLDNSRKQFVRLEQDLSALESYIELESLRFEKKFEYRIICDAAVDKQQIQLPPMIIQPFAENAIVHGLQTLKRAGQLTITIKHKENNLLHITIEDNGIGRAEAGLIKKSKAQSHQSVAMQLTKERLEKMNGNSLTGDAIIINDLYDESGQPAGTRVEINVPVEYSF